MKVRKILIIRESIYSDAGRDVTSAITRVVGLAVIANPCAGRFVEDLASLMDAGALVAERLMPEMMALLPNKPIAYGKAAIVGSNGEIEHAAAVLHPRMGKPMRAAVGGGEAIIPSSSKVAAAGAMIDVPLGNKDNVWSFDEIDTVTVGVADAPKPDEIVVAIAISDGGRPHPRVGKGRTV